MFPASPALQADSLPTEPPGKPPGSTENSRLDEPKEIHTKTQLQLKCQKLKIKKILEAREKQPVNTQGKPNKAFSRFFSRKFADQKWQDVFKMLKRKNFQPRILQLMSTQRTKYLAAIHEEK